LLFIDLHAHTSGISRCCRLPKEEILKTAKEYGFDGIALTNHFAKYYLEDGDYHGFVDRYLAELAATEALGRKMGLAVYFGVELSMEPDTRYHVLLYGADGDFLHAHENLFDMQPKALFELCRKERIFLVHAHPYRGGTEPWPLDCVNGYEINCHPLYDATHAAQLLDIHEKTGLSLTCGCDYHGDTYRAKGGVFLPETVTNGRELADYLFSARKLELQVQELHEERLDRYTIEMK